jgi:hypothetical protein
VLLAAWAGLGWLPARARALAACLVLLLGGSSEQLLQPWLELAGLALQLYKVQQIPLLPQRA